MFNHAFANYNLPWQLHIVGRLFQFHSSHNTSKTTTDTVSTRSSSFRNDRPIRLATRPTNEVMLRKDSEPKTLRSNSKVLKPIDPSFILAPPALAVSLTLATRSSRLIPSPTG